MDKVNIPEEIRYLQQEIKHRKDMIAFQNREIEKAKKSFFETCYPHRKEMELEEVIKLLEIFLGDADLWPLFEKWLEEKGYTPEDLGFEE